MFKNREILYSVLFLITVTVVSAAVCICIPTYGVYIIMADGIIFVTAFCIFCTYRYRKLRSLSAFLRKSQAQRIPLEAADLTEGEFSVLKNELYKVLTTYHSQAEQLKREKYYLADAISDISHQLKTPMTSMNVMIDLLKEETLPAKKRQEFSGALRRQMTRMEWLLSSMLIMSRIDAGAVIFKKEEIRLSDLINQAAEHLLIPMDLHNQKLIIEGDLSASFQGDFYWSREALANILKNCIEHTPDGGEIRIKTENPPLYTSIRIQDQGGGISEKDLPHIFERFYKGRNASPDSAGIGLALSDRLIAAQNGTIDVQTVCGEYTVFIIKFYHITM